MLCFRLFFLGSIPCLGFILYDYVFFKSLNPGGDRWEIAKDTSKLESKTIKVVERKRSDDKIRRQIFAMFEILK